MPNTSSVPTGGAPLFLGDFATPTAAIGQRMTERMIAQNKADQTRRGKERTAMLEALDFSAVEGLSQKVSLEHLDKMNSLVDKWSERWLTQGKELKDKDYLELQKDKLAMQQDVANKKHNVAQVAYAQKMIKEQPNMWTPESIDNLYSFVKEGNVGRDASQILVPQYDILGALKENISTGDIGLHETIEYDKDSGMNIVRSTKRPELEQAVRAYIERDPRIQESLNSANPTTKQRAWDDINSFLEFHAKESVRQRVPTASEIKRMEAANIPADITALRKKYPNFENIKVEDIPNAKYFNDFSMRVLKHDKSALDELKAKNRFGFTAESYDVNPDGSVTYFSEKKDKDGNPAYTAEIPSTNWSDADMVKNSMTTVLDYVPQTMGGKSMPKDVQGTLTPDWEVNVKESVPIAAVTNVYDFLGKDPKKDLNPEEREDLTDNLKALFPDSKFGVPKNYKIFKTRRQIEWDGDTLDLMKEEDREKIKKRIEEKYPSNNGNEDEGIDSAGTREEQQKEMDQVSNAAKENALSMSKKMGITSLKAYRELLTKGKVSKETIDRRIEAMGLTEEDFNNI